MNFYLSLGGADGPAQAERGFVRFDGATRRTDGASLRSLSAALRGVRRVHVDLGAMEGLPFALVSWLIGARRTIDRLGGRLTVGRAPKILSRVLSTMGLDDALELTEARS